MRLSAFDASFTYPGLSVNGQALEFRNRFDCFHLTESHCCASRHLLIGEEPRECRYRLAIAELPEGQNKHLPRRSVNWIRDDRHDLRRDAFIGNHLHGVSNRPAKPDPLSRRSVEFVENRSRRDPSRPRHGQSTHDRLFRACVIDSGQPTDQDRNCRCVPFRRLVRSSSKVTWLKPAACSSSISRAS